MGRPFIWLLRVELAMPTSTLPAPRLRVERHSKTGGIVICRGRITTPAVIEYAQEQKALRVLKRNLPTAGKVSVYLNYTASVDVVLVDRAYS